MRLNLNYTVQSSGKIIFAAFLIFSLLESIKRISIMNHVTTNSNVISVPTESVCNEVINNGSITIRELKRKWEDQLLVIPSYQRNAVWNGSYKRSMILSIYDKESCIPNIAIHVEGDVWNIVDGQQRIRSIVEYMEDRITLPKHLLQEEGVEETYGGKFSKLSNEIKDEFLSFRIDFKVTNDPRKTFLRLQNSNPLNKAERNHAMESDLNEVIRDLAQEFHEMFKLCSFTDKRFKIEEVIAGCAFIAVNGYAARSQSELTSFYRSFDMDEHKESVDRIRMILESFEKAIVEKQAFMGTANFRALFLLFHMADSVDMFKPQLNDFLKACATKEHLKARNRPGEEHIQKDALAKAYREFTETGC